MGIFKGEINLFSQEQKRKGLLWLYRMRICWVLILMLPLVHFGQLIHLFSITFPIPKMGSAQLVKEKKSLIINSEY